MIIQVTLIFSLLSLLSAQKDEDSGTKRLAQLRYKSQNSPDRIISFDLKEFKYIFRQKENTHFHTPDPIFSSYTSPPIKYPFQSTNESIHRSLYPEFNYTVHLYASQGAIDTDQQPVFFIRIEFNQKNREIFKYFKFDSAPNLVVSKPHMAVVSQSERQSYLKNYKWRMSHTDGVITTQKMLDFLNKRTDRNIVYKQTQQTIEYVISVFVGVCLGGVIIYKLLKFIWSHWVFWYIASMIVYVVCMSGIVYCVLGDSIKHDLNQRKITFFSGRGARDQTFFQGCLVSGTISLTGIILVLVAVASEKVRERYSAIVGVVGLVLVFYLISYIEGVYSLKSWYGPSYQPPQHYLSGPPSVDQGNNI